MIHFKTVVSYQLLVLLFLASCKTAEDIQREEMVDQLVLQAVANQKLTADLSVKLGQAQEQISRLTALVEESGHASSQRIERQANEFQDNIDLLEDKLAKSDEKLAETEKKISKQSKFISKITTVLKKATSSTSKKGKHRSAYDEAMYLYKNKKYTRAKPKLEALYNNKKIKGGRRARIIHNLGMISYISGRLDDSLVYFSKVFTKYPKSGYVKNSLYYLGHTFLKKKNSAAAKHSFQELLRRYPKSWQAKKAKKLVKI